MINAFIVRNLQMMDEFDIDNKDVRKVLIKNIGYLEKIRSEVEKTP